MTKILGLDLGIASVGYAVVNLDEQKFDGGEILTAGVRIFEAAENPKDGASLSAPRREARALRRILRRKTIRLQQIRNLFIKYQILTAEELNHLYDSPVPSVWEIRSKSLYEKQPLQHIVRALLHIAKRRGFRSMRKSAEEKNQETGQLLQGISLLQNLLKQSGRQTIGEFLYHLPQSEPKRNKAGSYNHSIARSMLEEEVRLILEKQRTYGNTVLSPEFEQEFRAIAFDQQPLKPSSPGKCTFLPDEDRAPKQAYTAELFAALSKINHIRIVSKGTSRALSADERQIALDLCLEKENNNFAQLRKLLELQENEFFNISYIVPRAKQNTDYQPEKKTAVYKMTGYHALRKALKDHKPLWTTYMDNPNGCLDQIAVVLATFKSDKEIINALEKLQFPSELIEAVKSLSFSGFLHLSLKAMRNINPFLLEGHTYDKACELAGYNFQAAKRSAGLAKLPPLTEEENFSITSPVVKRSIAQTRKVVNALNRKYGPFDAVHIELAREMGRNWAQRKELTQQQKENQEERDLIKEQGIEGLFPKNSLDIKKIRLWKEQGGYCIYSNQYIKPEQILEEGYCQVDHIIPYSRSFDNTLSNQVLCLTKENQDKRNDIPFDYFQRIQRDWDSFVTLVNASPTMRPNKKQKLLRTELSEEDLAGFKDRNLNDTRFISSFVRKYLLQNLQLTNKYKQGVFCRNGKITADLRNMWGLSKIREQDDKHHALDAIVLACCSNAMMQQISTQYTHNKETAALKIKPLFPWPWKEFRTDVENALLSIFVSRPPRKKITGAFHKETYYSAKHLARGFKTLKTDINTLTAEKLAKQRDLEIKYYGVERNKKLYDAIEQALLARTDAKQPLKVYLGAAQTPVKKIKLITEGNKGVPVLKGTAVAENGAMPRVDVFYKNGTYFLVPVYTIDFTKEKLPLISIPDNQPMDVKDFRFSLYKDDYVEIKNKIGETFEGYFKQYSAQTGQIYLETHDRSASYTVNGKPASEKKFSKNTFVEFTKYQIDILGNQHRVEKEKYTGITRKNKGFGG